MKPIGISPARRDFLRRTVAIAPAAAVAAGSGAVGLVNAAHAATSSATAPATPYSPTYFTADEWATLQALVDGLIPHDEQGPGALEAGVAEFIDRQMETEYAYGKLWYMHGPFTPSAPANYGYQMHYTPRELYRVGLAGLQAAVMKQHGKRVDELDEASRDALLHQLEDGKLEMGDIPAKTFFGQLLQNTHEGFFCDPKYGGNKDMAGWRLINFPGARADYMDWVEQYGKRYPLPPVSVG